MSFGGAPSPDNTNSNAQAARSMGMWKDFQDRYDPIISDLVNITQGEGRSEALADAYTQADKGTALSYAIGDRNEERLGTQMSERQRATQDRMRGLQRSVNVAGGQNTTRRALDRRELSTFSDLFGIGRGVLSESTAAGSGASGLESARNVAQSQDASARSAQDAALIGDIMGFVGGMMSSIEYKENVEPTNSDELLRLIEDVDIVTFNYKPEHNNPGTYIGMIAEDTDDAFTDPDKKAVNIYNFVGALVASVQALSKRVEELEGK